MHNKLCFYEHRRKGILLHNPALRLELQNKYLFNYIIVHFNNLPKEIRCEKSFGKYVKYLNDLFM